jgi:hypothetical protein
MLLYLLAKHTPDQQLLSCLVEGHFNIFVLLGRRLKEKLKLKLLHSCFAFFVLHLSVVVHILLSTNKYENSVLGCIVSRFVDPSTQCFIALSVSHTIHYEHCVTILIEVPNYRLESLLPSCVPYLQFHLDFINLDFFGEEFHTDGGAVLWGVLVTDIAHE